MLYPFGSCLDLQQNLFKTASDLTLVTFSHKENINSGNECCSVPVVYLILFAMFFSWDKAWNLPMRLYIALFVLLFTQLFANAANASPGHKVVADQRKSHTTSSEAADRKKRKPAASKKEKTPTTSTAKNKKSSDKTVASKKQNAKKESASQNSALASKFARNREVARNKANSKKIDKAVLASLSKPNKKSAEKKASARTATLAHVSNKKSYGRQRGKLNSKNELAKLALNQNNVEIVDGKPIRLSPQHKKRYQNAKQTAMNKLMNQVGKPYRWGGSSPSTGFDCSGLVYYAYQDLLSIKIPRTANEMYHLRDAAPVKKAELQKGDLVFFRINNRGAADHVGVYMGEGKFIQSPRTGEQIRISYLDNDYWQGHYVGARRVMTPKTIR